MKPVALFALVAMIPAALNAAPAAASAGRGALALPLCTGDGVARTITVPVGGGGVPGREPPGCCVKGCHGGSARKRGLAGKGRR